MHRLFTLKTLATMDSGRNGHRFNQAMEQIIRDVTDRPGDTSARTLTMKITVKPAAGQEGVCSEIHTTCDFKVAIPPAKSKVYSMATHASGKAIVNDASLDDIRQLTIDDAQVDITTGEITDDE
jgi:hypothetical protein